MRATVFILQVWRISICRKGVMPTKDLDATNAKPRPILKDDSTAFPSRFRNSGDYRSKKPGVLSVAACIFTLRPVSQAPRP
nr:hypothetical protein CFP56_31651 [Quercus suber]